VDPGAHSAPVVRVWEGGRLRAVWSTRWEWSRDATIGSRARHTINQCHDFGFANTNSMLHSIKVLVMSCYWAAVAILESEFGRGGRGLRRVDGRHVWRSDYAGPSSRMRWSIHATKKAASFLLATDLPVTVTKTGLACPRAVEDVSALRTAKRKATQSDRSIPMSATNCLMTMPLSPCLARFAAHDVAAHDQFRALSGKALCSLVWRILH
jgi:hypothetical protein